MFLDTHKRVYVDMLKVFSPCRGGTYILYMFENEIYSKNNKSVFPVYMSHFSIDFIYIKMGYKCARKAVCNFINYIDFLL